MCIRDRFKAAQLLVEVPGLADPPSLVHQGLHDCPLLTRLVVGESVKIYDLVGVCWLPVNFIPQAVTGPSKNQIVKKSQLIICFPLHGELSMGEHD